MRDGLSMNWEAVKARIRRLPSFGKDVARASIKRDAYRMIEIFQLSLENGTPVPPLAKSTIKRKKRKGYSKPMNPLRGLGMDGTRTYASSLRVYKTADGWAVRMPKSPHHESKLDVHALFEIHENGCTIKTRNGTIQIPARPVFAMAYREAMRELAERDPALEVEQACQEYMTTGKTDKIQAILKKAEELEAIYGTPS